MRIWDLDTPALLIDLDVVERNLARVARYAAEHRLRLRPHTKTHKIPYFARAQLRAGAVGLTVAKVGEAEVMLAAEPPDLLVAYPVVGELKLQRLLDVAARVPVTVSLDSMEVAEPLARAASKRGLEIGVLAEVDVGLGRVGVPPGKPLLELAQQLDKTPGLKLRGVAFYPGHIKALDDAGLKAISALDETLSTVASQFREHGLPLEIVSGGSTPTLFHSHRVRSMNEIRPGTYIFNDRNTVACGACGWEDCAATILCTVVSVSPGSRAIIDGGSKTFSSDRLVTTGEASYGYVVEAPEAVFYKLNEEHGFLDISRCSRPIRVGDKLRVIPNHICVAMNLHETVYAIRKDEVELELRVEARGKLR